MEKQHSYKKIEHDLKNGGIKNVLLLYGKEQYLVKWAVEAVSKKYVDETCKAFDFFEIDCEKATMPFIIESCETLSMVSAKRIVYMPDFLPIAGGKLKNFPESDEKALAEYIKRVPDTCLLILTSETADKRKKLYKEALAFGNVYDFTPLDERSLKSFVEKRFTALGKKIKAGVVAEFITLSGYFHKETDYTLYNLENEIKKIAARADGVDILLPDVLEVISGDVETNIFAMIDSAAKNKKDEAFRLLYNLLNFGGGNVFQILALLVSQFETMLEVKEMRGEGKSAAQIQSILNIHEFRVKKAAEAAASYSADSLKDILKKTYQVEKNIKTGIMDQVTALELLLAEV